MISIVNLFEYSPLLNRIRKYSLSFGLVFVTHCSGNPGHVRESPAVVPDNCNYRISIESNSHVERKDGGLSSSSISKTGRTPAPSIPIQLVVELLSDARLFESLPESLAASMTPLVKMKKCPEVYGGVEWLGTNPSLGLKWARAFFQTIEQNWSFVILEMAFVINDNEAVAFNDLAKTLSDRFGKPRNSESSPPSMMWYRGPYRVITLRLGNAVNPTTPSGANERAIILTAGVEQGESEE
jgi:hypothetical protein